VKALIKRQQGQIQESLQLFQAGHPKTLTLHLPLILDPDPETLHLETLNPKS